jgi:hypothetical protein
LNISPLEEQVKLVEEEDARVEKSKNSIDDLKADIEEKKILKPLKAFYRANREKLIDMHQHFSDRHLTVNKVDVEDYLTLFKIGGGDTELYLQRFTNNGMVNLGLMAELHEWLDCFD